MTFFLVVAWIMLFFGACWVTLLPAIVIGGLVGIILELFLSMGDPKENGPGICIGVVLGVSLYCYTVYWFLSNITLSFGGHAL